MSIRLTDDELKSLYEAAVETTFRSSGYGSFSSQYQMVLSRFDRYGGKVPIIPNHEQIGLTFFTRPKLNLTTANLRMDRQMSMVDSLTPTTLAFAARAYLDTNWSRSDAIADMASLAPFFNDESAFLVPLTNCITSFSGTPDPVIDTETTEGGFFSEDITIPRGSDLLRRSGELSITFRDVQGGFIFLLLYLWHRYIELLPKGTMFAYPEDIYHRRMGFTCSIYRFVLDPSKRFITKWAKYTGCYPKSIPLGAFFNFSDNESFLSSTSQFTVPFVYNFVDPMDPIVFREFNTIVSRFAYRLQDNDYVEAEAVPENNYAGIPYIDLSGSNEIKFLCRKEELIDPLETAWQEISAKIDAKAEELETSYNTTANENWNFG